jgi:hypothetical protein
MLQRMGKHLRYYLLPLATLASSDILKRNELGDVVYFKIFGRPMIVLNTLKAARDLMEKRSLNYSCRPRFVLLIEM